MQMPACFKLVYVNDWQNNQSPWPLGKMPVWFQMLRRCAPWAEPHRVPSGDYYRSVNHTPVV